MIDNTPLWLIWLHIIDRSFYLKTVDLHKILPSIPPYKLESYVLILSGKPMVGRKEKQT